MSEEKAITVVKGSGGRRLFVEASDVVIVTGQDGAFAPATPTPEEVLDYFESLDQAIEDTCATIFEGVSRLARAAKPSKVSAEVSFEVGGEGKIWFVAKGNAKAAVKVTAEWDLSKSANAPTADTTV